MIAVVDAFAPGGINDIRGAAEIRGEAEVGVQERRAFLPAQEIQVKVV